MKVINDYNVPLVDNSYLHFTKNAAPKSKSKPIVQYLLGLIFLVLIFTLIVRVFDIVPNRVKVFWIAQEETLEFNILFVDDKLDSSKTTSVCDDILENDRFDCYPDGNEADEEKCLQRGCCWKAVEKRIEGLPPLDTPYCYYPRNYEGYEIQNVSKKSNGFIMKLSRKQKSGFSDDILNVLVNVTYLDNDRLRIKIFDAKKQRYEVPVPVIKNINAPYNSSAKYIVDYDSRNLWITRIGTGTVIFNTSLATLIFADQMLQISIKLPSNFLYGIGESKDNLLRGTDWKRYTLFNRDRGPTKNYNLYGSHPFYLVMENDGNSHGVLLLNSNSMDVVTQPTPAITFHTIGGILDFYITAGPTPTDVVKQYTDLIGRSFMPPYWSLGFHLCRFGYNSINETREVWNRTRAHGIPFDTQWNDIDYMDKHNDFTIDKTKFGTLPDFVKEVHDNDMHYIMIIDPGISNAELPGTYPPYDDGVKADIFIKNISGGILVGKVWNSVSTVFPDFTNPKSVDYWTKQFQAFHNLVPFDGVWIDMNEPSSFVNGSIYGCPENSSLENPQFVPGGIEPLRSRTLCMTSQQYASIHYNVHNLYGLTELIATNTAVKRILQKRPFIITRSTFVGSGYYGGHWDGDIQSSWEDMRWTVSSILTLNMLGISMAGADICGFDGNTTVELCARWSTLGAFYPFSRNHNAYGTIDQDPVALGEIVTSAAKSALTARYMMLPTLYTLFYRSHVYGETVVRPMFFEFPNDNQTYALDQQFMWGSHILIVPCLVENKTETTGYLPKGRWGYSSQVDIVKIISSQGENFTFPTPLDRTNILFREGGGVVMQMPGSTTVASRKNMFSIYMFMNHSGYSKTELYWDDGETLQSYEKGLYDLIEMVVQGNSFTSQPNKFGYRDTLVLQSLTIQEVPKKPTSVKMNGKKADFAYNHTSLMLSVNSKCSLLAKCVVTWQ